uniref:non-specific serine/threonine protein kinase n=1 Tax=Tetraselmis sp. GSL018 TaxID=582737 RepID=A0A061SDG9_9CHLO|mmetsp:Transcript_760/g.1828  ORF Transcript_760/g.1828 Transcript_760/m.1828 type:complete len:303 (+) Transcript_760:175-1083(+)|eukprot:CAMPEP_0177587906 /NCGR_PEP_ID=MMETSP0419_2-20121207/5920_1 /TAXON_ID=582737 /ORGANISM="Tetraselmis sp., Strain GSL018" /LENGTH=302 /DNA_ID=CAMNT_0019078025 /DNA_START=511 /DNA_END=1419 /DNA_ORIENTATION=-
METLSAHVETAEKQLGHRRLYSRYKVLKYIGKGNLGSVFSAQCLEDGTYVAIKEVEVRSLSDDEKAAAASEIRNLTRVRHRSAVPVYDVFVDYASLCMVMGYVPGTNLAALIQQGAQAGRTMREPLVWKYFVQACHGLSAYHYGGLTHRNIKPSNLQVGEGQELLLGEPGITELVRASSSKALLPAPKYLAPEVWQGQPYGFAADIWALGCVLYELCSYKVPFEARSIQELRSKVCRGRFAPISARFTPELANIVYSLLTVDPSSRPNIDQVLASPIVRHYTNILLSEENARPPSLHRETDQ